MEPAWAAVALTVLGLIASAVYHSFLIGRKTEAITGKIDVMGALINGRFDAMEAENEHCRRDRHGIRDIMQIQQGELQMQGKDIAVLMDRRKHGHGENNDG